MTTTPSQKSATSEAAELIEKARTAGIVLLYDNTGHLWTWAPRCVSKGRKLVIREAIRRPGIYEAVVTLLTLACAETAV